LVGLGCSRPECGFALLDQPIECSARDEYLATDVRDPREHPTPHDPADRVLRDLKDLCRLGDRVDGRLAHA
jgi:hypothetical protein